MRGKELSRVGITAAGRVPIYPGRAIRKLRLDRTSVAPEESGYRKLGDQGQIAAKPLPCRAAFTKTGRRSLAESSGD